MSWLHERGFEASIMGFVTVCESEEVGLQYKHSVDLLLLNAEAEFLTPRWCIERNSLYSFLLYRVLGLLEFAYESLWWRLLDQKAGMYDVQHVIFIS